MSWHTRPSFKCSALVSKRPDKYVARLYAIWHDCDSAILQIDDVAFWDGLQPAVLGNLPEIRSIVLVAGFPIGGGELSVTGGVVSRIEDAHTQRCLLAVTVDATMNPGNSGGPVFNTQGELVGIAFQTQQLATNIRQMIQPPVIHHFLQGVVEKGPDGYQGFPGMGFETQDLLLENWYMRDYLQLNATVRCGDQNQQSTLTWFGETDKTYYLFVTTADDDTAQGSFSLQLSELDTPENDFCAGAKQLTIGETFFKVSVQSATAEFIGNGLFADWDGNVLPGVFYNVIGMGAVMKAAAPCDENTRVRVFVYKGDCKEKSIVGEKVVCQPVSAAYWETVKGEVYHILLQSDSYKPVDLTVSEERPELNDLCTGASGPIQVGSLIEGDGAVVRWSQHDHRNRREGDLLSVGLLGLFYTVIGMGCTMQVSSPCDQGSATILLSVFAGSCQYDRRDYVLRVSATMTWCKPDFAFTWPTVEGETYYIEVTPGPHSDVFQFTLTESGQR